AALALLFMSGIAGGLGWLAISHAGDADGHKQPGQDEGKRDAPQKAEPPTDPAAKGARQKEARIDAHGHPLPGGALARLGTVRFRNGSGVSLLAFAADGKTMAYGGSGGVDNVIRLVNARTGKELSTFAFKEWELPERIALSPDGKLLAVGIVDYKQPTRGASLPEFKTTTE